VRARDRAHSAVAQDVQSAEPGRWRGPFGQEPERRKALGRVSLVPFFARAKKGTRSAEGRVEAFALKRQNNQKQKLDSSFRWNDERKKGAGFPPKIRGNDKHRPLICQTFQPDPRQNYADIHPATSARLSQ